MSDKNKIAAKLLKIAKQLVSEKKAGYEFQLKDGSMFRMEDSDDTETVVNKEKKLQGGRLENVYKLDLDGSRKWKLVWTSKKGFNV